MYGGIFFSSAGAYNVYKTTRIRVVCTTMCSVEEMMVMDVTVFIVYAMRTRQWNFEKTLNSLGLNYC